MPRKRFSMAVVSECVACSLVYEVRDLAGGVACVSFCTQSVLGEDITKSYQYFQLLIRLTSKAVDPL